MRNNYRKSEKYKAHAKNESSYNYSGDIRTYDNGRGRTSHRAIVRFVKLLDVIMVSTPFILAWAMYYSHKVFRVDFYRKGNWLVITLFIIVYYMFSHLYQGYLVHISRISELVYAQTLGVLITDGIMFIIMWLLIRRVPNILVMLLMFAAQFLLIIIWSKTAHRWYFKHNPPIPTAIVFDELEGEEKIKKYYGLNSQ